MLENPFEAFGTLTHMVIAVASQKGGTGKTTTSISLAAGLAHLKKKVLLIDIDSQANSSKVLLSDYAQLKADQTVYDTILNRHSLPILQTNIPNLNLVASHILLSNTDVELTTAIDHREARLKSELDAIRDQYDYVIIDCPPALGWLTINAFTAAEGVIVVVSPGYFELDSTVQIGKTIKEVQTYFNANLQLLGFLFNMSDPTTNSKQSLQTLRQTYTDGVFQTVIPRNTDIKDAHASKQDIFSYDSHAKAALAYRKLIQELFHL